MKKAMLKKSDIYALYGIQYITKETKLVSPIGKVSKLLINGNHKIGSGVWHFSTLAGDRIYKATVCGKKVDVAGTCAGTCENGYCVRANYRYQSTINALATRTVLVREYLDWTEKAIQAQIHADNIKTIRIHATGDFFSVEYLEMWKRIIKSNPDTVFWTYTKETGAENAFDEFENANIVKSNVPMLDDISSETNGYNFGHIDYIIALYNALKGLGKSVYICRCGIDKNQHCTNCTACAKCENVLFIEHGTSYKAEKDPRYQEIVNLINSQDKSFITE